jgi:hypothetical protein
MNPLPQQADTSMLLFYERSKNKFMWWSALNLNPGARIASPSASGKYRFFLMRLSHAYHGLAMILSIIKQKVSKHDRAWVKPSPPMNSAYQRLIVWLTLHLG